MLCRVAEDVFWMSRYVERAVAVGRLIDVTWHLELDAGALEEHRSELWAPLLGPADRERFLARGAGEVPNPREVRHYLAFDRENPNSLVCCISRARSAARGVRESISTEMWEQLNTLYLSLVDPNLAARAEESPHAFYKRVREGAQFFQGLADCTMAQDEPWLFICLGKYLERADNVARILAAQAHLLLGTEQTDDIVAWLAVLRSCGSAEAYSHYYSLRIEPARVVEFLLLNPVFPQSVRFSLGAAWAALNGLAGPAKGGAEAPNPAVRALGLLHARIEHAAVDEVLEEGLQPFLMDVQAQIATVAEHVTRGYLTGEPQSGRVVAVARAAMIMAAQQQQ